MAQDARQAHFVPPYMGEENAQALPGGAGDGEISPDFDGPGVPPD
jgi:hypothetical protein